LILVWVPQRNKPDAMIILYDSEERISTAVAVKMFERGCDNVFVVTGGRFPVVRLVRNVGG
jgi:hypothetical protein